MSITFSNYSVASSNAHSSKTCATSPYNPAFNGSQGYYCGSCLFVTSVSGFSSSFYVYYEIHRWNTGTLAWDLYDEAAVSGTDGNGTHHHAVDFFGPTAANGMYCITCWVGEKDGSGHFTSNIVKMNQMFVSRGTSYTGDPLPRPEPSPGPYPGDDPPIDHPELPPSGPVGPGALQTW